jgi:hypothetical protein
MLLAAEFWQIRSVNDTVGIIGFLLTLFSIWLSWWLAKRDIERRIQTAKDQVTDKLSLLILQTDISETLNALIQARESCRNSAWVRAIDRCEQVMHRIPKFMPMPGLTSEDREQLGEAVDVLRL